MKNIPQSYQQANFPRQLCQQKIHDQQDCKEQFQCQAPCILKCIKMAVSYFQRTYCKHLVFRSTQKSKDRSTTKLDYLRQIDIYLHREPTLVKNLQVSTLIDNVLIKDFRIQKEMEIFDTTLFRGLRMKRLKRILLLLI